MASKAFAFGKLNIWAYLKALISNIVKSTALATTNAGLPIIYRVTATTLTGDIDITVESKVRVIDVWAVVTGTNGAADTVQVKNGTSAISNALDMNAADTTVVRAGTLDDAQWNISDGGTLRVTGASGVSAEVYILAIPVG
jgi:hypothetical protein